VPERWPAIWSEIVEVSQLADRAGFEFLLPIARWKGFGGEMNSREWSYETLTHAAALGAAPLEMDDHPDEIVVEQRLTDAVEQDAVE
jgi:hypothetical protein